MYLFPKPKGGFVCGKTSESDCPAGIYRLDPSQDKSSIQVLFANTDILKYEAKVTEIQKADDSYYSDFTELEGQLDGFFAKSDPGVCGGCLAVVPSDAVNLPFAGWIQPRTAAGNIKFTDVKGNTMTLAFDAKEVSMHRVSKVWAEDTTATGIVVYY